MQESVLSLKEKSNTIYFPTFRLPASTKSPLGLTL